MSFLSNFLKKYNNDYAFLHELFPEALTILQKYLLVLNNSIDRGRYKNYLNMLIEEKTNFRTNKY